MCVLQVAAEGERGKGGVLKQALEVVDEPNSQVGGAGLVPFPGF